MGYKVGRNCKVVIHSTSTTAIAGLGTWSMDGITTDQIDTTSFGSLTKTFEVGMQDGGQITFAGIYDPDNSPQTLLRDANYFGSHLYYLKLYVDATSYFVPDNSYPSATNPSYVLITQYTVSADKSDVIKSNFTAKVSGKMKIV